MSEYRNFTVELPARIAELDRDFKAIAEAKQLEVSYLLMKLAASFLLPYERLEGTSGAGRADISDRQVIRKHLYLDRKFHESNYSENLADWCLIAVDDFHYGPRQWLEKSRPLDLPVHKVLSTVRHFVAHSNLFFGGEASIEDVYLGSRRERDPNTQKYTVIRCTVGELNHLVDAWIMNVQRLRVSPALIWNELERAA